MANVIYFSDFTSKEDIIPTLQRQSYEMVSFRALSPGFKLGDMPLNEAIEILKAAIASNAKEIDLSEQHLDRFSTTEMKALLKPLTEKNVKVRRLKLSNNAFIKKSQKATPIDNWLQVLTKSSIDKLWLNNIGLGHSDNLISIAANLLHTKINMLSLGSNQLGLRTNEELHLFLATLSAGQLLELNLFNNGFRSQDLFLPFQDKMLRSLVLDFNPDLALPNDTETPLFLNNLNKTNIKKLSLCGMNFGFMTHDKQQQCFNIIGKSPLSHLNIGDAIFPELEASTLYTLLSSLGQQDRLCALSLNYLFENETPSFEQLQAINQALNQYPNLTEVNFSENSFLGLKNESCAITAFTNWYESLPSSLKKIDLSCCYLGELGPLSDIADILLSRDIEVFLRQTTELDLENDNALIDVIYERNQRISHENIKNRQVFAMQTISSRLAKNPIAQEVSINDSDESDDDHSEESRAKSHQAMTQPAIATSAKQKKRASFIWDMFSQKGEATTGNKPTKSTSVSNSLS